MQTASTMLEIALVQEHLSAKTRINVVNFSKANVTSWLLVLASMFVYGCARWTQELWTVQKHTAGTTPHIEEYFLCTTNNTKIMDIQNGQHPIFPAYITNDLVIFLTNQRRAAKFLPTEDIVPCGVFMNDYVYTCCKYSPNSGLTSETSTVLGSYKYAYKIEEGPFLIENIIFGRNRRLQQNLTMISENFRINTHHKSSADVANDPYPEIHMDITISNNNGTMETLNFHWYL